MSSSAVSSFFSFSGTCGRRLLLLSSANRTSANNDAAYILSTATAISLAYLGYIQLHHGTTECEEAKTTPAMPRIAFLGTGSSTGCPRPICTMMFPPILKGQHQEEAEQSENNNYNVSKKVQDILRSSYCRTSIRAMENGGNPRHNKDYRNNPSLLITTSDNQNIIIDTGKTFRESALRWFPVLGVQSIDAIVLTHEHMDACAGLDDVRGFQKWTGFENLITKGKGFPYLQSVPMPIFASKQCLERVSQQFPWLIKKDAIIGSCKGKQDNTTTNNNKDASKPLVKRHVASFDVNVIEHYKPFMAVEGFDIVPLPIMHGEDLVSLGFAFTIGQLNVVYLSDISRMIPETLNYIQTKLPQPTHVLIVDSLHPKTQIPVHYSFEQAFDLIQQIKPIQTYLVVSLILNSGW